jgi:endonuclease YncB( thermonuclease family)
MRDYAMASATAAILALFATSCDDVASETVVRAEPAEAASIDSRMGPPLPTQAEGKAVAQEEATVTFVIDGDTVDVALADEVAERVRLPQVDTPEADECGYEESMAALQALIAGENVTLVATEAGPDRDTYGRLLRAIEIDGDDVGHLLIRNGIAHWIRGFAHEDSRRAAMYEAAESSAREESAGFWSTCGW